MIIISTILGALFNRIRGGLLNIIFFPKTDKLSATFGKLLNALVFGAICAYILHNWLVLPAAALGMFIGASFAWGKFIGGVVNHTDTLNNAMQLSLRGLIWTSAIAVSLYKFTLLAPFIVPIGLLMPLGYYLCSFITTPPKAWGYGEVVWGGILWGLIALILTGI